MANDREQFTKSPDGQTLAYDPHEGRYVQVTDVSQEMREMSREFPVTNDEKRAFYQDRIDLVRSAPLRRDQRRQILEDIRDTMMEERRSARQKRGRVDRREIFDDEGEILVSRIKARRRARSGGEGTGFSESRDIPQAVFDDEGEILVSRIKARRRARFGGDRPPIPMPIPGGVGCGIFYKENKLRFRNSSTLYYHIITAPNAGSAENEWLYLTTTNRAPWCCEAFVSYKGQQEPRLVIFDWSKRADSRWRVSIPISLLNQYQFIYEADSVPYRTIYLINDTRRLDGYTWINRVFLRNRVRNRFDIVHQNKYILPPEHEQSYLWWGPIVETFHPHPNVINEVGFFDVRLFQDEQRRKLTPDVIDFKRESGFELLYFKENSSFIVH
ncbi:MAG TPA: hypothetical protein VF131_01635 [Blastocatellia bacterium]|nr:hypothetical protein [Blastocatellia bacterium]